MIVFKNYLKIIKKFLGVIFIYTGIFLFFAITTSVSNNTNQEFTEVKPDVAIISEDNSLLISSFKDYVGEKTNIVNLDESKLEDALFYREVDYIMIIPNNYGEEFLKGNILEIETKKVADSYNSYYSEMLFNKYFNIAATYVSVGMDEENIVSNVKEDLNNEVTVEVYDKVVIDSKATSYFNFANYTFLAVCIFIVGLLCNVFNNKNIKNRNSVSPMKIKSINFQLMLGNIIICFLIWLVYILFSIVLYKEAMFTFNGLLFMVNSLVFVFTCLSFGFLVGNLIYNKEAQAAIVNVVSLGTSFICGAFVPQEYLSESVLNIGKLFPSYWYISNNQIIGGLNKFDFVSIKPLLLNMFIVLCFGIGGILLTNIVTKRRQVKH